MHACVHAVVQAGCWSGAPPTFLSKMLASVSVEGGLWRRRPVSPRRCRSSPPKKDTAVACTLSSVWGQWRTRSRADHKAARCHWRNNAVRSMGMAAQHAWMRIRTSMPLWRDLTSDLYRLQLFISFDFRDFGQAQHKPRLRAISFLLHTLCGRYTAPTRAFPPPPFFAISLAVLVRIAAGMNVSGRGDVRNTCVHMCSNSLAPKRSR